MSSAYRPRVITCWSSIQTSQFRVSTSTCVHDFQVAEHLAIGAGGLFAVNFVPDALAPAYGGHNPTGAMAFVRLRLD